MKNKLVWIFLLLTIPIGLFFYYSKNQTPKENPIMFFLNQQYGYKYLVKSFDPIGNFLVTSANSNTSCCGENSLDPFDEKATPSIIVNDVKSLKIKSIYEVSFIDNGKENKGNLIYLIQANKVKDYFVAEWSISYGGSSGLRGLVLFGVKDGQFQPITGYPFNTDKENNLSLTDQLTGKRYSFPIITDSYFTSVQDLNNDSTVDLLYADWKWDLEKGESHYQPRPWNLQVFELVDNNFRVAKWWNKGEIYKTPENIGYDSADTFKLIQTFTEKSK